MSAPLEERFRPKRLDDVIGQDEVITKIKGYIKQGISSMPHLLFYGPPGTGKTSCAHAIANELNCEIIELNSSTERGIDIIRDRVIELARTMSQQNERKIIFMDEADELTENAQTALRRVTELNYDTTIFIFSCNNRHKMIPALINRCKDFYFRPLTLETLKQIARDITTKLGSTLTEDDINTICLKANGSARTLMIVISEFLVGGVVPNDMMSVESYITSIKEANYQKALFAIGSVGYEDIVIKLIDYLVQYADSRPEIYGIITKIGDWVLLNPAPNEIILKKTLTSYLIHYRQWLD